MSNLHAEKYDPRNRSKGSTSVPPRLPRLPRRVHATRPFLLRHPLPMLENRVLKRCDRLPRKCLLRVVKRLNRISISAERPHRPTAALPVPAHLRARISDLAASAHEGRDTTVGEKRLLSSRSARMTWRDLKQDLSDLDRAVGVRAGSVGQERRLPRARLIDQFRSPIMCISSRVCVSSNCIIAQPDRASFEICSSKAASAIRLYSLR